jgi:hypothetical protein
MRTSFFVVLSIMWGPVFGQQEVKNFSALNIRDGKTASLNNYTSSKAVAIVFTSHECPFDNYYKDRLKELIHQYQGKVQFLLVNANSEPAESAEQMGIHYTDLPVPYLADKDQKIMDLMGAKKTPEVFLLSQSGGQFYLVYHGAIDDNPQVSQDVRQQYLKDAIEATLSNKNPEAGTQRVTGCTIRRK